MRKEASNYDTGVEIINIFTIPGFTQKATCLSNNAFCKNIFYLFITFIISLIGYSSFVNFFIEYKEKEINVTIKKMVSNNDIYENSYNELGNNNKEISYKKEKKKEKMDELLNIFEDE